MKKLSLSLTIGWLYPELMSTYGDRGNIFVLKQRVLRRGFGAEVIEIDHSTTGKELSRIDMVIGGGSQDREQEIVISDLLKKKDAIKALFDSGTPGLFVCGSPQLLGHSYMTGDGTKLSGLGLFDMETIHPGAGKPRCIGNLVAEICDDMRYARGGMRKTIVGFENHGGRTILGRGVKPFAHVLVGNGNNGNDKTEGALCNNFIATYSHGPFLPKNPHIADYLISHALYKKYKKNIALKALDDSLAWNAHEAVLRKCGIVI
ncbi:cobalamin biosynthesis protein CobQ [Candidatus Gottesmanbacteria bacterium]|nr:cobalamin biosynthesis protein CobQ [Candidatus Gottesmanbacteria bacterium]